MTLIRGAMTALITPFTQKDELDVEALRRIVKMQVQGGIDGLVLAGTTGESPTLTEEERHRLVDTTLEIARGKVPIVLGTGTNATRTTVHHTKQAKAWGADAALVVCPYYNKPTQEGLFRHFKAVYEETGLPVVAYNVPSRTASDLLPETIARLVEIDAIVAVKDATANMQRAIETLAAVDPTKPFVLMSGDDFTILPFVACGGAGVISVVSNLAPGDTARLVRETVDGNWEVARPLQKRLIDLSRALFSTTSPIPVKAAMARAGWCQPHLRLPLVAADEKTKKVVEDAMRAYGGLID